MSVNFSPFLYRERVCIFLSIFSFKDNFSKTILVSFTDRRCDNFFRSQTTLRARFGRLGRLCVPTIDELNLKFMNSITNWERLATETCQIKLFITTTRNGLRCWFCFMYIYIFSSWQASARKPAQSEAEKKRATTDTRARTLTHKFEHSTLIDAVQPTACAQSAALDIHFSLLSLLSFAQSTSIYYYVYVYCECTACVRPISSCYSHNRTPSIAATDSLWIHNDE